MHSTRPNFHHKKNTHHYLKRSWTQPRFIVPQSKFDNHTIKQNLRSKRSSNIDYTATLQLNVRIIKRVLHRNTGLIKWVLVCETREYKIFTTRRKNNPYEKFSVGGYNTSMMFYDAVKFNLSSERQSRFSWGSQIMGVVWFCRRFDF